MYKWICDKCGAEVIWDGQSEKPDTTCVGSQEEPHVRTQMPLREMPELN